VRCVFGDVNSRETGISAGRSTLLYTGATFCSSSADWQSSNLFSFCCCCLCHRRILLDVSEEWLEG